MYWAGVGRGRRSVPWGIARARPETRRRLGGDMCGRPRRRRRRVLYGRVLVDWIGRRNLRAAPAPSARYNRIHRLNESRYCSTRKKKKTHPERSIYVVDVLFVRLRLNARTYNWAVGDFRFRPRPYRPRRTLRNGTTFFLLTQFFFFFYNSVLRLPL